MNQIYLTDVVIRCLDGHSDLPADTPLFIEVVMDGNGVQKTKMLTQESTISSWRLDETIELSDSITSTRLTVTMEYPDGKSLQLGFTDVTSSDLVAQCADGNHEFARELVKTGNSPSLELVSFCSVISLDIPEDPSDGLFRDATEEEAYNQLLRRLDPVSTLRDPVQVLRMFLDIKYNAALQLPDENDGKLLRLKDVGGGLYALFVKYRDNTDLDGAIAAYEAAVRATPDGHQCQAELHIQLGSSLFHRFEMFGRMADIDNAIFALEGSVILTPDGHVDKHGCLDMLGNSFARRFTRSGNLIDSDKAISAHERAVMLTPDGHADKPSHLNNLGISLLDRFEHSGDLVYCGKAVSVQERAVNLTPDGHADKPPHLANLGKSLLRRFQRSGNLVDGNRAISIQEQAVNLTADGHVNKPRLLNSLGASFLGRFDHSGNLVDVEKAISAHERAVNLTADGLAEKIDYLNNLGIAFLRRFERSSDLVDNDKAISAHKQAVDLIPDDHAKKPHCLTNLGNSFLRRFEHSGNLVYSDKAISAHQQAVNMIPDGHAVKPSYLNNLGDSFFHRFKHSGDLVDIDKAISAHEQAVNLTPNGHASKLVRLTNLGSSLMRRFQHSGNLADSDKAISFHEQAVNLTPEGHTHKSLCLNNLGSSLLLRFRHSHDLADIDKAIYAQEQAVKLILDGHAEKPNCFNNLGISLMCRFEHAGNLVDIDKAISAQEKAVNLLPDGHADKPQCLNNLGNSFSGRFVHSRDLVDIDKAISAHEQAVHFTPDGHAGKPGYMHNLGNAFLQHFECSGDQVHCDEAISSYCCAATSSVGAATTRFTASLSWARLASREDVSSSLPGYTVALNLVSQIAWLGYSITARHKELSSIGAIASEAAAAACAAEQYNTALEWLEQGRSIVWNQLLSLRTPLDDLHDVDPTLADSLAHVSTALEQASTGHSSTKGLSPRSDWQLSLEEAAQRHHRLAEEWERLVARVQTIVGFEGFLQPTKLVHLHHAAKFGPVVIINVYKSRCDALVLVDGLDDVIPIQLDGISYAESQRLHHAFNQLLLGAGVRGQDSDTRKGKRVRKQLGGGGLESILSSLWSYVVKPVLDGLAFQVSCTADPPRIWWCATGPFAFLPIHAAGIYNKIEAGFNISDYVVSSYTPTLSAISNVHRSPEIHHKFQGLLAVSQPNTLGQPPLPQTEVELDLIQQHASKFGVHLLRGSEALEESVIEGMEVHSWVHLACHAMQDTAAPTKSAFYLHDNNLTLSTIIAKKFVHADFAFLSACQTATGDETLSEEAVHLAAGLMLAGYRSVIATMWSIRDKDAPVIAGCVYEKLFSGAEPDSLGAALALHHAVKLLRQQVGDSAFLSWVPFIHVGL